MYEEDLIPSELWRLVGLKLDALNRIRFRAVSKLFMSLIPQPPWLMLAQSEDGQESASEDELEEYEAEDESGNLFNGRDLQEQPLVDTPREEEAVVGPEPCPNLPPRRRFVCLGEQQVFEIDFPQLHLAQCVGSKGNWLITMHKDRTIRLLNPFSREQFYLPPESGFGNKIAQRPNEKFRHLHLWKIILSNSPSIDYNNCIAMALHGRNNDLAIARVGDSNWTTVLPDWDPDRKIYTGYIEDMNFYKGRFYAITKAGVLMVCDLGDGLNPPTLSLLSNSFSLKDLTTKTSYLVEWLGELLLVDRYVDIPDDEDTYKTKKFEVYLFDFKRKEWTELKSLGEHSLFLGFNTSVSLCASDYFGAMRRNCIYFTDNFLRGYRGFGIPGGHDMGVYDLEDHSIMPHFEGLSTCLYSPPVWIVPT